MTEESGNTAAEAVIVAGDFNSLPASAVHELLTTDGLSAQCAALVLLPPHFPC